VTDAALCSVVGSITVLTPNGFSIVTIETINANCGNNGIINIGGSTYYSQIETLIKEYSTPSNILIVSVLGFVASFLLGSSAKYAGIVSLLTSVFGMQYFVLFFTLEYSAYLISPSHKCLPIGQKYFHTGFLTYLKALIIWISFMLTYAILTVL
jgi:hypothetical protein